MKTLEEQLNECLPQWEKLVASLIPDICDDPDDETPGMQLTVGFTPETENRDYSWSYQTGDNSYSGGAYLHANWGVVSIFRDSNPAEIASDIADQISDLIHS